MNNIFDYNLYERKETSDGYDYYVPYDYDEYKDNEWFEFGIYDFSEKEYTWDICKKIFNEEILQSYVSSIGYNIYDNDLALEVVLSKEAKGNE